MDRNVKSNFGEFRYIATPLEVLAEELAKKWNVVLSDLSIDQHCNHGWHLKRVSYNTEIDLRYYKNPPPGFSDRPYATVVDALPDLYSVTPGDEVLFVDRESGGLCVDFYDGVNGNFTLLDVDKKIFPYIHKKLKEDVRFGNLRITEVSNKQRVIFKQIISGDMPISIETDRHALIQFVKNFYDIK